MRNEKCGTMVIRPQVRPRDRSYYAVYHTPHTVGTAVSVDILSVTRKSKLTNLTVSKFL